jgi:hypothetical protein
MGIVKWLPIAAGALVLWLHPCSAHAALAPGLALHKTGTSTYAVYLTNQQSVTRVFSVYSPVPMVTLAVAPNHDYTWCRDEISQYQQAEETFMAAVLGFAALTLTGVGYIETLLAAGTFQQFAAGLGYGSASAGLLYLYERTLIDDQLMRQACG